MAWAEKSAEAHRTLHEVFGCYCDKHIAGVEPIKKIMLVGALYGDSAENGFLSLNDFKYLDRTLMELHKAGIPISKNFEVEVVNDMEGRNFLDEEDKTDLIVMCNLFPPHYEEVGLWNHTIKRLKPKIVSILGFSGDSSLYDEDIKVDNLVSLLQHNFASYGVCKHSILMSADFIERVAQHLDPETEIGKKAGEEVEKMTQMSHAERVKERKTGLFSELCKTQSLG